jgi:hypothetical protein
LAISMLGYEGKMDLQTFSLMADILGSISVIAAIIFGVNQITQFRRQRRDQAAIELVRSVQDSEFTSAFRLIHSLPTTITAEEFKSKGAEYHDAALTLGMRYETIGLLVFRRVIPITIVEDLVGGVAISLWERMGPWVHSIRKEQSQGLFLEWFEWVVERLHDRQRNLQSPAFIKYVDWQE